MVTIELKEHDANLLGELLQIAIDDMSDWATYNYLERGRCLRELIYKQLIDAGAQYNEEEIPEFKYD